jgi:hypothetical protein
MKHTTMPGFTAEHSLYIRDTKYNSTGSVNKEQTIDRVLPQFYCERFAGDDVCCWFRPSTRSSGIRSYNGYCILDGKLYTYVD